MASKNVLSFLMFVLVTVLVSVFIQTLLHLGYFKIVLNHSPGPCRVIQVDGSEDVEVLDDGFAFISSGMQKSGFDPNLEKRKGKILFYDFNNLDKDPLELTLKSFDSSSFNPHGLSVYRDRESQLVFVFVINHKRDGDVVEIFEFDQPNHALVHRRSVKDTNIYLGNDLVAVGPTSFYLTNSVSWLGLRIFLLQLVEIFLRLPLSNVVYYNGEKSRVVVTGIPAANGINIDPSGRYVFVNAWMGDYVAIYERHQDNSLKELQKIDLGFSLDNINVDVENGDLWIAGTPRTLEFFYHLQNVTRPCSSQVVKLHLNKLPSRSSSTEARVFEYEARDVYTNDGRQVKATSAAVHYKGKMLVGSVFDSLLLCELRAY